jgi:hypothetical protein
MFRDGFIVVLALTSMLLSFITGATLFVAVACLHAFIAEGGGWGGAAVGMLAMLVMARLVQRQFALVHMARESMKTIRECSEIKKRLEDYYEFRFGRN